MVEIPLAVSPEYRDPTRDKDAHIINAIVDPQGRIKKRPGTLEYYPYDAGQAQGFYIQNNNLFTIIGDTLNVIDVTGISNSSTVAGNWQIVTPSDAFFQDDGKVKVMAFQHEDTAGSSSRGSEVRVYETSDGFTWSFTATTGTPPADFSTDQNYILEVGSTYYLTSLSHEPIYSSTDLVAWVESGNTVGSSGDVTRGRLWHSGGTFYWITSIAVYSSTDRITWTQVGTDPLDGNPDTLISSTLTVGSTYYIYTKDPSLNVKLYSSTNLVNWTLVGSTTLPGGATTGPTVYVDSKFWMLGASAADNLYYSTGGLDWTLGKADLTPAGIGEIDQQYLLGSVIFFYHSHVSNAFATSKVTIGISSTAHALSVTTSGLKFDFVDQNPAIEADALVFKSSEAAWVFESNAINGINDAQYPTETVRGIVYLDGTYYVMTPEGRIYGSDLENPESWTALNVIQCQGYSDGGVALFRQGSYIAAFGKYSLEFFYNAGNPTGSPLLPVTSAIQKIGCASGDSIADTENTLVFMGVTKQRGRSIYVLEGTNPKPISDAFIDRILSNDDLSDVYATIARLDGDILYILRLGDSGTTLVYNFKTQRWSEFKSTEAESSVTISSATRAYDIVSCTTSSAHGLSAGQTIKVAGATPSLYNGVFIVREVVSSTGFTYQVRNAEALTVAPTSVIPYTTINFNKVMYASDDSIDWMLGLSDGIIYRFGSIYTDDNELPIEVDVQTGTLDGNTGRRKFNTQLEIMGDQVDSASYIRYTDDDYQTYSPYRQINMALTRKRLTRLGSFSTRAYQLKHVDDTPIRAKLLIFD